MKTYEDNDSFLYALVAAFLRGAIKGLALSSAFFVVRDYLECRQRD